MMVLFAASSVFAQEALHEEDAKNSETRYYVVNDREDIDEDFTILSVEEIDPSTVEVLAEVKHKKGWFSTSEDFTDRFLPPQDLIDQGYRVVKREMVSWDGSGGVWWEELNTLGYTCVVHLSKKWLASMEVVYKARFIMAIDYTLPEAPYKPILVSPVSGRIEITQEERVSFQWDGEGTSYRLILVDRESGAPVFKRSMTGHEQKIKTEVFKHRNDYAWGVAQADDHLIFSPYEMKPFRSDYKYEYHEQTCQTCNGHGYHWADVRCTACGGSGQLPAGNGQYKPCGHCNGHGTTHEYIRCQTCYGDGTVTFEIKRLFLVFD